MAKEHITITIKKATELYVLGGVSIDPVLDKHVFWYAVRKWPVMSKRMQQQVGARSRSEYIEYRRPEWTSGEEPPQEYVDFYKSLPEAFEEGSEEQIRSFVPELGKSVTVIAPVRVDYYVEATGGVRYDLPVVIEIIKRVRELIWSFPVEGTFTAYSGLQADKLRDYINSNLMKKEANNKIQLQKYAENLQIKADSTRYIDVATGTIFNTEQEVQKAIEKYHEQYYRESEYDTESEPMLAAASKGGMEMNIGELLKIANLLDESGDFESADEITEIIQSAVNQKKIITACDDCGCEEECEKDDDECEPKKAWLSRVMNALVRVANSLDAKGATKEAQLADDLLQSLKSDLPQAFTSQSATPAVIEVTDTAVETAVVEPIQETQKVLVNPEVVTKTEAEPAVVNTTEVQPEAKVQPDVVKQETSFSKLPDEKSLQEVKIEGPKGDEPQYDEVTIDEFKGIIQSMKLRHSQGPQRQKYEEILKHVERAREYYQAYKEWNDYAHEMFGDEPIRIKIE